MRIGQILVGRALLCDYDHNLIVDLGCCRGVIPREEGALGIREQTVRDIAIISRVNKPVCFLITAIEHDENGALRPILSRRAAQLRCRREDLPAQRGPPRGRGGPRPARGCGRGSTPGSTSKASCRKK